VAHAEAVFAEHIGFVAEAGADLILIETQHDIDEACCAIRMARKHTSLPAFCSFAFNARGRTMMGLRPQTAAQRVMDEGGHAVGANCGEGPAAVIAALQGMAGVTTLPLIAQANAGVPQVAGHAHTTIWDITPEAMAAHAVSFASLGAQFIGGCCGTTPAHIAALRDALASHDR
jgi:5-methyltetrahydrofolate--homocysteine methyltransferase